MKKFFCLALGAAMAMPLWANVRVDFAKGVDAPAKVSVQSISIADAAANNNAARQNSQVDVVNGSFTINGNATAPMRYVVMLAARTPLTIYEAPGENITLTVTSLNPLAYEVAGSDLMAGMKKMNDATSPILAEINAADRETEAGKAAAQAGIKKYYDTYKAFAKDPSIVPAAQVMAILSLQPEDFTTLFSAATEPQKSSIIWPLAESQNKRVLASMERERKLKDMIENHVEAPNFTLKNLEGKDVSLTDFRGKWVIIDFWGGWCKYCIMGIPALKDAYKQYAGRLEVIGVDCNESEEDWRKAVAKYELPWVHVYNPKSSPVLGEYLVTGFPTKVIVNPEGRIADIVIGEDPSFYTKLAELMK